MCGASSDQKQISAEQDAFYAEMTSEYKTVFAEDQGILKNLTDTFTPILEKGPGQEGFTEQEKSAIQTQINETNAGNFKDAERGLEQNIAARNGGNEFLPSGADNELRGEVASAFAGQRSSDELKAIEADYSAGSDMFKEAARALGSTAGLLNPIGMSSATTSSGEAASKTASDIAAADNSVFSSITGALGGVAGAALGEGGIASGHHN
jgi:hypothetical protein